MKNSKIVIVVTGILLFIIFINSCQKDHNVTIVEYLVTAEMKVELGRDIFFDKGLSNPVGQSCSSCHNPATAFTDPGHNSTSAGAVDGLFGNRNAPIASYTMFIPPFHYDNDDSAFNGGLFLDGRENTLEDQVKRPFLNKIEMNNDNIAMVISKLKNAPYLDLFTKIFGKITDDNITYQNMADALATFVRSPEMNPFTSKYDYYLKGEATLTAQELRGLNLFKDTVRARCGNCHIADPDPEIGKAMFTDFSYNSDGVPKNPNNRFYTMSAPFNPAGASFVDSGLGAILHDPDHYGKFRVPSLRNVAVTAPYFHNGVFNTLEEVVHFYNTRDVLPNQFDPPEVAANVDSAETGNLHLTLQEEQDIVAFLKTLTDGFK